MSDTNEVTLAADGVLKYGDHQVMIADIAPKGLAYLVQYGFAQSLQDSVAGYAKRLRDDKEHPLTDDEIAAKVSEKMAERFADIVAGEVGIRSGAPRLSGVEKIMRDVAREAIKAQVVALNATGKKLTMPTGEKLGELVEKYIAKHADAVKAEAERRMANTTSGAVDDDIAAMLEG